MVVSNFQAVSNTLGLSTADSNHLMTILLILSSLKSGFYARTLHAQESQRARKQRKPQFSRNFQTLERSELSRSALDITDRRI